jgi:1-acyl-sn-glycerol-3-phosphate acyltransferase
MLDKVRSVIFNLLFYVVLTPGICILMCPTLLMPRRYAFKVARSYHWISYYLEKYVMGLDYEIRGRENIPSDTESYLVAEKHYSAYETMKLYHFFYDPTIILKKELLSIPIFGWFLKKVDVIALDRGNREKALTSLIEGAQSMKAQNRPIVIFPQGTRVAIDATPKQKPYKGGIAKLYTTLNIPVLPIAHNSGLYWPRNSFWKKSGKVIFEVLPPIPTGLTGPELMAKLEEQIESASNRLVEEGRKSLNS